VVVRQTGVGPAGPRADTRPRGSPGPVSHRDRIIRPSAHLPGSGRRRRYARPPAPGRPHGRRLRPTLAPRSL